MATRRLLPTAEQIDADYPVDADRIAADRATINGLLRMNGNTTKKLLVIVGPCSAYPFESVERVAESLARLQEEIDERVKIIMRFYTEKPRTNKGWQGMKVQPNPLSDRSDMVEGIQACRAEASKLSRILPLADEMVFPENAPYMTPALSYIAVGARTVTSQSHRNAASGLPSAVGFKNNMDGCIEDAVDGMTVAQSPQTYNSGGYEVTSDGNPDAHIILRGGKSGPNYDADHLNMAGQLLSKLPPSVTGNRLIVDAGHGNSGKVATNQIMVARNVLQGIRDRRDGYQLVGGLMIEAHVKNGHQKIHTGMDPEVSITDDCLALPQTEDLLRELADMLDKAHATAMV